MNSKPPANLQDSLRADTDSTDETSLIASVAKQSPFRKKVVLTAQDILRLILFSGPDEYGSRDRNRVTNLRLGQDIEQRFALLIEKYPKAEKTRIIEVALDLLMKDLGL